MEPSRAWVEAGQRTDLQKVLRFPSSASKDFPNRNKDEIKSDAKVHICQQAAPNLEVDQMDET